MNLYTYTITELENIIYFNTDVQHIQNHLIIHPTNTWQNSLRLASHMSFA